MSRIGRLPIKIPAHVQIKLESKNVVLVKGDKGQLQLNITPYIECSIEGDQLQVSCKSKEKHARSMYGTTRALLNNMVIGVRDGFTKQLIMEGVGYRAQLRGKVVVISVGFSHPVEYSIPEGIVIELPKPNQILIKGIDKQRVGEVAAEIRSIKPPEPYKGKGIKYLNERIRRKAGKAAKGVGK